MFIFGQDAFSSRVRSGNENDRQQSNFVISSSELTAQAMMAGDYFQNLDAYLANTGNSEIFQENWNNSGNTPALSGNLDNAGNPQSHPGNLVSFGNPQAPYENEVHNGNLQAFQESLMNATYPLNRSENLSNTDNHQSHPENFIVNGFAQVPLKNNGKQQTLATSHNPETFRTRQAFDGNSCDKSQAFNSNEVNFPNCPMSNADNLQAFHRNENNTSKLQVDCREVSIGSGAQVRFENLPNADYSESHPGKMNHFRSCEANYKTAFADNSHVRSDSFNGKSNDSPPGNAPIAQNLEAAQRILATDESSAERHINAATHGHGVYRGNETSVGNTRIFPRSEECDDYQRNEAYGRSSDHSREYEGRTKGPYGFHLQGDRQLNHHGSYYEGRTHHLYPFATARTLFLSDHFDCNDFEEDFYSPPNKTKSYEAPNFGGLNRTRISPINPRSQQGTQSYRPLHGSGASVDFSPVTTPFILISHSYTSISSPIFFVIITFVLIKQR